MAALGRQHSATNGCFREAKLQRQLSGDELEETSVASRPEADIGFGEKRSLDVPVQRRRGVCSAATIREHFTIAALRHCSLVASQQGANQNEASRGHRLALMPGSVQP